MDITQASTILGLDGREPHRAELAARANRDIVSVSVEIGALIAAGHLVQDGPGQHPRPTLEAIAQAERLLSVQ